MANIFGGLVSNSFELNILIELASETKAVVEGVSATEGMTCQVKC